jgi:hypothetical protein
MPSSLLLLLLLLTLLPLALAPFFAAAGKNIEGKFRGAVRVGCASGRCQCDV